MPAHPINAASKARPENRNRDVDFWTELEWVNHTLIRKVRKSIKNKNFDKDTHKGLKVVKLVVLLILELEIHADCILEEHFRRWKSTLSGNLGLFDAANC